MRNTERILVLVGLLFVDVSVLIFAVSIASAIKSAQIRSGKYDCFHEAIVLKVSSCSVEGCRLGLSDGSSVVSQSMFSIGDRYCAIGGDLVQGRRLPDLATNRN